MTRLGVIARADDTGLGAQTGDYVRHLRPDAVLVVDMGSWCTLPARLERFPDATVVRAQSLAEADVDAWLARLGPGSVVLSAETFYLPSFTRLARARGVRTALAPNPEFSAVLSTADWLPPPDLLLAPTPWLIERLPDGTRWLEQGVDRDRFAFRHRPKAETFLHVAGRSAAHDRNGTQILLRALPHVTAPCRVVVRTQEPMYRPAVPPWVDLEIVTGDVADPAELYADADVMVQPRRWGGQHLPMLEALSCGLPVLMPDCEPNRQLLPDVMRLPCAPAGEWAGPSGPIELHDVRPEDLAARMDALVADPAEVAMMSRFADQLGSGWGWRVMAPRWRAALGLTEALAA